MMTGRGLVECSFSWPIRWALSHMQGVQRPSCSGIALAQSLMSCAEVNDSGSSRMHRLFHSEWFSKSSNFSQISLWELDKRASMAELAELSSPKDDILSSVCESQWARACNSMCSCSNPLWTAVFTVAVRVGVRRATTAWVMPAGEARLWTAIYSSEVGWDLSLASRAGAILAAVAVMSPAGCCPEEADRLWDHSTNRPMEVPGGRRSMGGCPKIVAGFGMQELRGA